MLLLRLLPVIVVALLLSTGCRKQQPSTPTADQVSDATTDDAALAPSAAEVKPDDPAVVQAIQEAGRVLVKKSGEHIVELDLQGLTGDAASDQADEFAWVAGLPMLQTIKAKGPGVSLEAVRHLQKHPSVSVIAFESCTQIGDQAVEVLVTLPKLADVDLMKSEITDESLKTLASSDSIKRIRIVRTKVTDAGIKHLEQAPQLELLDLLECSALTNDCATSIGKLTRLRNVRLPNSVDDSGLSHIKNLKGLVALGLQYCRVGPEGIQHLTGLSEMKELDLYGASKVNDEVWPLLAQLPKLTKLRLRETSIRGEEAGPLATLQQIQDLDLSESPVQDAIMTHVAQLPNLEKLNLWNTEVTAEGFAKLEGNQKLKRLSVEGLGDAIDDDALDIVTTMVNLESLDLAGTGVTDEGMAKVHALKKLKYLNLKRTYVVEKGTLEALREALPNVKIDW